MDALAAQGAARSVLSFSSRRESIVCSAARFKKEREKMSVATNVIPAPVSLNKMLAAQGSMLAANRMNTGGTVSWEGIYSAMNKLWAPSLHPETLAQVDAGGRSLDYRDLEAEYNNRYSQVATNALTAAMINGAGAIPTQRWAPFFITTENNFVMNHFEVIAMPFIRTAAYGLGRLSTYKRSQRTASLEHVKRSFEIEGMLLVDPNFGPMMLQQGLGELATSARTTVCLKISGAIVDVPYVEELRRLHNPVMPFSHTRQMFFETQNCFLGSENPEKVLNAAMDLRDSTNKFDTIIGPSGWINRLSSNQAGARGRPMPAFALQYNTKAGDFLYDTYDGENAFRTLTTGDGGVMDVTENIAYTASADDPETQRTQTLRARVTLGEVSFMKVRDTYSEFSGRPEDLDVGVPDHQRHTIVTRRLRYLDALGANAVFSNYDGTLVKDGPSNVLQHLIDKYNAEMKREVYSFFREDEDKDQVNDMFPTDYNQSQLNLSAMTKWRGICGFVAWDDVDKKVVFPALIGDVEPKTLPPDHLAHIARAILTHGAKNMGVNIGTLNDTYAEWEDLLTYYLPGCKIEDDAGIQLMDAAVAIDAAKLNSFRAKAATLNIADPVAALSAATRQKNKEERAAFYKIFANPLAGAVLVPLANETVDAFKTRLSADALASAAESDKLGLNEIGWAALLSVVPDESLGDFLAIAHEVQKDGRELTALEADAVASFAEKLRAQPRGTHVAEILKQVRTRLDKKEDGATFAQILGQQTPFLSATQEKRLAGKPEPAMNLAQRIQQSLDADVQEIDTMDIDEVPAGRLSGLQVTGRGGVVAGARVIINPATANVYTYSWAKHELHAKTMTTVQRIMYGCLLNTPFNYEVCKKLALIGCELMRFLYVRPFAQFTTDAIVVMRAGPTTMITGIGHFGVVSGLNDKENALTVNAEFKVGVVCVDPKGLRILPAAICYEFHGGRNTQFVRKIADLYTPIAHRPSVIALVVPVNETRHSVPLSLSTDPAYGAPNTAGIDPFQKHSGLDLFIQFVGEDNLSSLSSYANESFWQDIEMATQLQRSICCYYNTVSGQWDTLEGTGPLGAIGRNVPQAAECYFNRGTFPTNYERLTVVQ
jgi:hypothetical protein